MKRVWRSSLLAGCVVLTFVAPRALALEADRAISQYAYKKYGIDDGLPQSSVDDIAQTGNGYLWFATQSGLARFDGLRMTSYAKATPLLAAQPHIESLTVDRSDVLWIGGMGAGLLRYREERFDRPQASVIDPRLQAIRKTALAPDGSLWIGSQSGLFHVSADGRLLKRFEKELLSPSVVTVVVGRNGTVWGGTAAGLVSVDRFGVHTFGKADGMPAGGIRSLLEDRRGTLWIGTERGLYSLRGGRFERQAAVLRQSVITALGSDSQAHLWVGTPNGVWRLDAPGSVNGRAIHGLDGELVLSLFEDREKTLWVGTFSGVIQLRDTPIVPIGKPEGLANEVVLSLYEDAPSRTLYIGTDSGLAIRRGGTIRWLREKDGLPGAMIEALTPARNGGLWIGTIGGLCFYKDERLTCFGRTKGLSHNVVSAVVEDNDGSVWVGTSQGINHLRDQRVVEVYTTRNSLLASDRIITLERGVDGGLWIGTGGGALQCLRNGHFTTFVLNGRFDSKGVLVRARSTQPRASRAPNSSQAWGIYSILEEKDGTLWLSTSDGLLRKKGQRWTKFRLVPDAADATVYRVIDDRLGFLWASTGAGIIRVRKTDLTAYAEHQQAFRTKIFDSASGMRSRECNGANPSVIRSARGLLLFGTIKGVASVDPAISTRNELPPPVIIEEAWADSRRLPREGGVIPKGTKRITFRFTANTLVSPERVRFKYRLEGFDRTWINGGSSRTATYTLLPPGRYRFHVAAANADGVWNETGASMVLVRAPGFRETPLFFVLIACGGMLVFGFGHSARLRHLRRHEAELLVLVNEKTADLQDANRKLHLVSRTDPLTGIANRRHFEEHMTGEWRRALRQGGTIAALMIDVDFFKRYNDHYGHQAGDECLRAVAAVLRDSVTRAGDLVARYGGEEFVVVMPNATAADACAVAESTRKSVGELGLAHAASDVARHVTVSIGSNSMVVRPGQSWQQLLEGADQALYRAKSAGRNRVRAHATAEIVEAA